MSQSKQPKPQKAYRVEVKATVLVCGEDRVQAEKRVQPNLFAGFLSRAKWFLTIKKVRAVPELDAECRKFTAFSEMEE